MTFCRENAAVQYNYRKEKNKKKEKGKKRHRKKEKEKRKKKEKNIMADYLRNIVKLQKQGKPVGIYSACTGNRLVLEACMRHAMETGTVLLIESTANQVDQYGGYTGMKPADFMEMCKELAKEVGMPMDRIILGGDHLGPLTFAGYDEEKAMSEARELIRQYVAAGFTKNRPPRCRTCKGCGGYLRRAQKAESRSRASCLYRRQ